MPAISILTLNIEGDNHLDRVQRLLLEKQPDIVCFQEIYKSDVPMFQKVLGVRGFFAPLCRFEYPTEVRLSPRGEWGVAIFSRVPIYSTSVHYYVGKMNHIPVYGGGDPNICNRAVIITPIQHNGQIIHIATTHFTWSPEGSATDLQHENLSSLLEVVKSYRPLLLCGDFNAPRGKSVFERLANEFKDNLPTHVKTTIDQELHRVKGLQYAVDNMFTTPELKLAPLEVIQNVSDHNALFSWIN